MILHYVYLCTTPCWYMAVHAVLHTRKVTWCLIACYAPQKCFASMVGNGLRVLNASDPVPCIPAAAGLRCGSCPELRSASVFLRPAARQWR